MVLSTKFIKVDIFIVPSLAAVAIFDGEDG